MLYKGHKQNNVKGQMSRLLQKPSCIGVVWSEPRRVGVALPLDKPWEGYSGQKETSAQRQVCKGVARSQPIKLPVAKEWVRRTALEAGKKQAMVYSSRT